MKTAFRPQVDGFAFRNSWMFDENEKDFIVSIVDGAIGPVAAALGPLYAPVLGLAVVTQDALLDGLGALFGIPPGIISAAVTAEEIAAIASGKLVPIFNNWIKSNFLTKDYGFCGGMAISISIYGMDPIGVGSTKGALETPLLRRDLVRSRSKQSTSSIQTCS